MLRVLFCAVLLMAPPAAAGVEPVLVASGLSAPLRVTAPAGDFERLVVVEQGGRIRIVKDGALLGTNFLDLSGRISSGGERFLANAVVNDGPAPGGPGTHDGSFVPMEAAE